MGTDDLFRSCWRNWCQYLGQIENADLADICEVSSAAVTGWLNGSRKPRANKISRLSNFIHELIVERKVVIAPHNRSDFKTIFTTYQHKGDFPTANVIRATFEGTLTVEQALCITPASRDVKSNAAKESVKKHQSQFFNTYIFPASFSILLILLLVTGTTLVSSGAFTKTKKSGFQHSELVLSVDGIVRKVSLSSDGQLAILWKPPGGENFDVYLVDKQQVITPILQSEANEVALDWGPQGNTLALMRITQNNTCEFVLLNVETHEETFLTDCFRGTAADIVWSRNGENLYFPSREKPDKPLAIYSYSLSEGQTQQLTFPENISFGDFRVIESLSGNKLAYLRSDRWSYSELRTLDLTTSRDELFKEFDQIVFTIDWGFDDDEILVVPWQSPNQIERINVNGERSVLTSRSRPIGDFELSNNQQEIVLQETQFTEDIFKASLEPLRGNTFESNQTKAVVTSTRSDWQPKLSPDNQSLAFLSNRSGTTELWVSDADGKSARPLTKREVQGMRIFDWSPDGRKIVVDSSDDRIYVVTLATKIIKPYSPDGFVAKNPSWGHDSKKIYVASDTDQAWQIWAIDEALASPRQITNEGGYSARESDDGHTLIYTRFYHDGIWKMSINQSASLAGMNQPTKIVDSIELGIWVQWQLIDHKIYYAARETDGLKLMSFDLTNNQITKVIDLPDSWGLGYSIFVSNNEKDHYFSKKTTMPGSEYILIR